MTAGPGDFGAVGKRVPLPGRTILQIEVIHRKGCMDITHPILMTTSSGQVGRFEVT